jgi:hypothetical protein
MAPTNAEITVFDREGRGTLRALEKFKCESKLQYLDRLSTLHDSGQLAKTTAGLLKSDDDRVRARAVELVARVSVWFDRPEAPPAVVVNNDNRSVTVRIEDAPDAAGFIASASKALGQSKPETNGHDA